jgi:uncharacterized protein (DUF362 family)
MAPGRNEQGRAKVALARLPGRQEEEQVLGYAIDQAVRALGGLGRHIPRGGKVLLKPNQTLFKDALSGSTTSPRLIRSLIHLCFNEGAREVWVAEAAGHAQQTRRVMSRTGMLQAVKNTGAHLIYLDEVAHKVMDFGEDAGEWRYMPAAEVLERADVIINVPKAKTHFIDPISCACKNWVGLVPMSFRLYLQRLGEPYYRATGLFLRKFQPALTLLDGGIAGEGQGPGSNEPFWWGWIGASTDPVAMDVAVCRLFGLDWQKLRMSRSAADLGVGVFDPERIDLVGATFAEAQYPVRAADPSVHRYPCRVIVGDATMEGTLGHWKTIADAWLETDLWKVFTSKGKPTFLFGAAEDPDFDRHLQEGPYVALGDTVSDRYKYDPRVRYVPGWPVPQSYLQHEMVEAMGFGALYQPGLKLYQSSSSLVERLRGVSGPQAQKKAILQTAGVAAIAVGAAFALRALRGSREEVARLNPSDR